MTKEKQSHETKLEEGYMTAEQFAVQAAGIVFNQGKAKIFNLLESQLGFDHHIEVRLGQDMPESHRLKATKRMAQDIISGVAKDVKQFIIDFLGPDWKQEVLYDPNDTLTGNEEEETKKEFEELEKTLK